MDGVWTVVKASRPIWITASLGVHRARRAEPTALRSAPGGNVELEVDLGYGWTARSNFPA